jgi:hypothetical protein
MFGGQQRADTAEYLGAYNHSVMVAVYPGTIITPAEVSSSFGVSIPRRINCKRRQEDFSMRMITVLLALLLVCPAVFAADSGALSDEEVSSGLKQALAQSAGVAADKLGTANGFLDNPKVRIPLPGALQKAEGVMRTLGAGKYADNLITAMNRAAEMAVAEGKPLLLEAVEKMPVEDAAKIIGSANDAATQYFRNTTSEALAEKFLPIVKNTTDQANLLKKYKEFANKGVKFGLIADKDANIENYVTQKTLEGLYLVMAEEERAIRSNPMGQTNQLLRTVFGTLKQSW